MNYFNNVTNEVFIKFFVDELYSKTEFIQYSDSAEEFDPEQEYGKHITDSQEKLLTFILDSIKASGKIITPNQATQLFDGKKKELFSILLPEIDNYISKVKVDYK